MFVRFFTQLNQYPKLILLVILALSAFFFVQARDGLFDPVSGSLRINSTVEPFIERDSGAYQQFLDAREAFGSEEVVVIALHNTEKEPVGLDYLLTLSHLKADIETNVPGISKVLSMLDIPQASGKCAGKSYFHQMGIGSVCLSVLEKYEHQISCLNSSSADKSSSAESDDNLEESLEESLEEGLEDELEDSPEQNLEESLEDSLDENLEESLDEDIADSGNSETEVDAEEDTSLDCALEKKTQVHKTYMLMLKQQYVKLSAV